MVTVYRRICLTSLFLVLITASAQRGMAQQPGIPVPNYALPPGSAAGVAPYVQPGSPAAPGWNGYAGAVEPVPGAYGYGYGSNGPYRYGMGYVPPYGTGYGVAGSGGPYGTPGGYEGRVGSPYYYQGAWGGAAAYGDLPADPYTYHFGPGYYRYNEHGHYRFPWYSYRRPWYYPGHPSYNRDTNLPW